jgi:hypothetical protein
VDSEEVELPLGRFHLNAITVGSSQLRLREDAALAWSAIVQLATSKGATLGGTYGDSARPVRPSSKLGTSRHSFHYSGRAVDIAQEFTLSANHRYWIVKEPKGPLTYWRIWCKTDKQDGSQGVQIKRHTKKWWDFARATENWIPEGYYLDLTALIESTTPSSASMLRRHGSRTMSPSGGTFSTRSTSSPPSSMRWN